MSSVATKFTVTVVYNGVTEAVDVESHEQVSALLARAENAFHITQNRHLFGLFLENGNELADQQSAMAAGLQPGQRLLLRQSAVRGGGR